MFYNYSVTFFSHAIIVKSLYRIPNSHLVTRTFFLLFGMVGCTCHYVLLKRHLKAVSHSILFSVRILFIDILSIRITFFHSYTFFSSILFFSRILFICIVFFVCILFLFVYLLFAYIFSLLYF